jgi:hypothetical protein
MIKREGKRENSNISEKGAKVIGYDETHDSREREKKYTNTGYWVCYI